MKTIEELKAYYETDLLPTLRVLDRERKKNLYRLFLGILLSVAAPIIALYFFFGPVGLMVISFPVWIGVIIYLQFRSVTTRNHSKSVSSNNVRQTSASFL